MSRHHHKQNGFNDQTREIAPEEEERVADEEIEAEPEREEALPAPDEAAQKADEDAEKIAALTEEVAKLKDSYLRSQAEMENLRRRTQTELEKRTKYAVSAFAGDLLSVADNLKRALNAIPAEAMNDAAVKNIVVGLEMTQKDLSRALEKNGVTPVDSLGKVFDPNVHKVVQEVEDPSKPAGTIVQEWQTGYMIGDRVLREAVVVVSKGGARAHEVDTTA